MLDRIKGVWDKIQALLDIDGDVWMGAFTAVVIARYVLVHWGWPQVSTAEAMAYGSAITSFAYSNKGPKQS